MQVKLFPSAERGMTEVEWLHSRHSFSFGNFYSPERLNFGTLRVLNEDVLEPRNGFPLHSHENMEIVTIVLEGSLEHKDSLGNHGIIRSGEIQRMSAGTGVRHSEYNPSDQERVHFLQIWVFPKELDIAPSYEQKSFKPEDFKNRLCPILSERKNSQTLYLHQDADFFLSKCDENVRLTYKIARRYRGVYIFLIKGEIEVSGHILRDGDALGIEISEEIVISCQKQAYFLLIEVGLSML
jgi:quercetin 2,3-dioxygenase